MNKAFKVIWNHATQSWTAVSEIARSKGKTKSVKTAKTALATAVAVAAVSTISTQALGAVAIGTMSGTTPAQGTAVASGWHAIAIGEASTATASRSTAIGHNAKSTGAHAIAIGTNANVTNQNAIAIGQDAKVETQMKGIAIGAGAQLIRMEDSQTRASVVLGADALARNVSSVDQNRGITALGTNSLTGFLTPKDAAYGTTVSLTDADYATVSGDLTASRLMYRAGIVDENGVERTLINKEGINVNLRSNEATAIGYDSRAIGDQSIAIGAQVVAGHSSVAIGNNDMGAAATPDAIETYEKIVGTSLAANTETINGVSWYETTYAKEGSVAIGAKSHSNELFGTAIGTSAFVEAGADLGTAIGTGARVGNQTTPSGAGMSSTSLVSTKGGVAIAAGSVAEGDYTTAVGTGSNALDVNATALGYKALANATNATAVGSAAIAAADNALAYGANATAYAENSVAIGTNATVTDTGVSSIAFGSNANVSGERSVALGNNITALSTNGSVVLGDSSVEVTGAGKDKGAPNAVETVKSVTIGSGAATLTYSGFAGQVKDAGQYLSIGSVGAERQIKNVAPGAITNVSTDAINGSQLYAALDVVGQQIGNIYFHTNDGTGTQAAGDSATNLGKITDKAGATGAYAVTAGVNSTAISNSTIAMGHGANAGISRPGVTGEMPTGDHAIAIGTNADAQSADTIAIGRNARVLFTETNTNVFAIPLKSIAIGADSKSQSEYSTAIGFEAIAGDDYHQSNATSVGARAKAVNINTLAVGSNANASGTGSSALGVYSEASGNRATAVGFQSQATGDFGVALGAQSDAAYLATATGTGAQATAEGSVANGYRAIASGVNSVSVGRSTQATETNATALGRLAKATHVDAVALGSGSTTTTANPTTEGTVANITYGTFAGVDPTSVVSVGSAGAERQIVNVAAGRISPTSTDAINGSQLYFVAEQAAKPLTITANTNADTDAELLEKQYAAGDGTQQQLGETLAIIGAKTAIALTENTDAATAGAYSARNIQTVVTNGQVQIQMATNPVFNSTVIGGKFDQDGNQVGSPITIGTTPDGKNVISNLNTTIQPPIGATETTAKPTTGLTNAATLGDVLNAGWNLKENGDKRDVVTPYDTVDFVNGNGTTVSIETKDNVSTVKVDVNLSDSAIIGDITSNPNGTTSVGTNNDGNKLANISTVVDAINSSGWNVTSGATVGVVSGTTDELVKPGETVKFIAGKNIELTQDVNNFTFAVSNNPVFNSTTIGGTFDKDGNQVGSPIVISTTPDGKNVISNLNTTLPEPSTVNGGKSGKLPDNVTTTNAATLGDVLNAGWNLKTADQGDLDFVKPYDTVNFKNGNGTTVVSSTDGNVSNIQYDVKVDNSTVKINSTTGAIEAVQPVTQVNGNNVTGPVNLVNGNTTTVTNTPDGIKVEVNTGNTTVGTDGKAAPLAPEDANKVATVGDIINTINNVGWFTNSTTATGGADNTKISAGKAVNFEAGDNMQITQSFDANGNVTYTYATKQDVSFNSTNIGAAGNPITIGTVNGDNVISNLGDNLPSTSSTSDKPTTTSSISPAEAAKLAEEKGGNAATVNDVLNAGWNLETNGKPLDFVKPYDTVNFKDGNGTTIVSTTNGSTSNIQVDVAVDNSTIKIVDGKLTAVSSKPSITDNQSGDQAGDINFNNTNTTTVNVDDKGNVTVDVNTGTSSATDTGLATPATDKDGNPLVKVEDPVTGDVTYTNAAGDVVDAADVIDNSDKVATVGDIVNTINNTGWQATSGAVGTGKVEGTTTEVVKPSELVTFQAGDNMVLKQEGQVFTYSVSPTPVFTNVTAKEGITLGNPTKVDADGKPVGPVVEMKPVTATTPVDAAGNTNAPVNAVDMGGATFTNLAPNLPETVSTGNATTSTPEQKAPVVTDAQKSNAATLGDVLNAGWNLQNNGTAKDFVKPYDTVNFANGTGTVARVDTDGNVSNVYYDVAVDGTTTEITYTNAAGDKLYKLADGTYNTQKDGKGTTVAAGDITGSRVSAILPTTKVNGGDVTGPVNLVNGNTTTVTNTGNGIKVEVNTTPLTNAANGTVNTPAKPNAIATAGDVAKAINGSGFTAAVANTSTGVSFDKGGDSLVNPGDKVTMTAGDNISITKEGLNYTVATKKDVSFDNVAVGPVSIDKDNGINAGNTKITGVKAGEADTDAVNVAQLKATQTTVGSADGTVKVNETVSANGQRHFDLSVDPTIIQPVVDRVNDLEDDMRAGLAGSAAMVNIPQVTRPGANLVGVGLGHHKGESAIAVGFSSASDNERLIFKMTGSANTQGDFTIGTGMGWQW